LRNKGYARNFDKVLSERLLFRIT